MKKLFHHTLFAYRRDVRFMTLLTALYLGGPIARQPPRRDVVLTLSKKRKHGDKQSHSGEGGGRYRLVGYPRKTKGYEVLDIEKTPHPMVSVCRHIHLQENVEEFPSCSDDSDSSNTSDSSLSTTTSSDLSLGDISDLDSISEHED